MKAATAVHNVAQVLDVETPNWWRRIDFGTLDMTSATRCVMGQLYGRVWDTPSVVEKTSGFHLAVALTVRVWRIRPAVAAWRREVAERRERERRVVGDELALHRQQRDRAAILMRRFHAGMLQPSNASGDRSDELVGV